jgi:lysophospholipase L1-like esterase
VRRLLAWAIRAGAFLALVNAPHGRSEAAEPACDSAACVNLVFDGDSISAGWGASPGHGLDTLVAAALGAGVRSRNVAVGGRRASKCLKYYPRQIAPRFVAATPHNVIVFHAGDNDVARGSDGALAYAAVTAYVAMAHRDGWKVVVSVELPRPDFDRRKAAELADFNDRMRQNKAGADAVVDWNADPRMTNMSNRADPALFSRDGIHPSDGGYAVLAAMLAPAVRRVAGR